MSEERFRIFGAEVSPYSVKLRSYLRYKAIPHEWIPRSSRSQAAFEKYAKLPLIPLLVSPEGEASQDSTPILEAFEATHPEPSIHPVDPTARFVSALLEELGDEWGNKWMFHYRWAREVDQLAASGRIAALMMPDAEAEQLAQGALMVRERMKGRVWFVGSSEQTAPLIESSFRLAVAQLDEHLASRPYLFGGRPAFADFGLWGQLYNAWTDPTAGAIIEGGAQNLLAWIQRMLWPRAEGAFEDWGSLEATLLPFLSEQAGARFLPWSVANAKAIGDGAEEFRVDLAGGRWVQKPQKYHARSLAALQARYREAAGPELDALLARANCLDALR